MTINMTRKTYDEFIGFLCRNRDDDAPGGTFLLRLHDERGREAVIDFLGRLAHYNKQQDLHTARIGGNPRMSLTLIEERILDNLLEELKIPLPKSSVGVRDFMVLGSAGHLLTSVLTQNPVAFGGALASFSLETLPMLKEADSHSETQQAIYKKFLSLLNEELEEIYSQSHDEGLSR